MNKKPKKTTKNLYDFDYESKKEKKIKKKKADKKSASKAEQSGQAEKKKKYEDEIIIGVTRLPDKKDIHNKKEKKTKTTIIPKKIIPKSTISWYIYTNCVLQKILSFVYLAILFAPSFVIIIISIFSFVFVIFSFSSLKQFFCLSFSNFKWFDFFF